MFRALILLLAVLFAAPAAAQGPPPRSEAPIRQLKLSNGALRYAVPVTVGKTALLVSLDTGSTGLRILPGALAAGDAAPSDVAEVYGYASGSRYVGVVGRARVAIGGASGTGPVHLIRSIGCFDYLPGCPASRTTLDRYGIASDGLPGEGFRAILGIDMAQGQVGNPLRFLGARRWIVELPRPGEGDGRLILNPSDDEVAGYAYAPLSAPYAHEAGGGLHDAAPGCLVNSASHARVCGPVLMDTGAPWLSVVNARGAGEPWPEGSPAALEWFDTEGGVTARETLVTGVRDLGTRLTWRDETRVHGAVIYAGIAPYFAYSVLYDPAHRRIGLKARPAAPLPDAPQAVDLEMGR
ncbi:MAG: hypothetical protein ACXWKR_15965 [Phenylobacterium sp.]